MGFPMTTAKTVSLIYIFKTNWDEYLYSPRLRNDLGHDSHWINPCEFDMIDVDFRFVWKVLDVTIIAVGKVESLIEVTSTYLSMKCF